MAMLRASNSMLEEIERHLLATGLHIDLSKHEKYSMLNY